MQLEPGVFAEIEEALPAVRRFALSLTRNREFAEDLVQDCLERAISRIDHYQAGSNMRSWLFTILRNLFLDQRRQQKRRGIHVSLEEFEIDAPVPDNRAATDAVRDLQRAFSLLTTAERQILLHVAVDGLSYEEVAELHNVALGTVKSRLFRAREHLRHILQADYRRCSEANFERVTLRTVA